MVVKIQGTVRYYNVRQGYGFIVRHDGLDDVFVHSDQIKRTTHLRPGTVVAFRVAPIPGNPGTEWAEDVEIKKPLVVR